MYKNSKMCNVNKLVEYILGLSSYKFYSIYTHNFKFCYLYKRYSQYIYMSIDLCDLYNLVYCLLIYLKFKHFFLY